MIRDRDAVYGGDFDSRLASQGITGVRTPPRAPTPNAIAERIVRTIRTECLDHLIVIDERLCTRCWPSLLPTTIATGGIAASVSRLLSQEQDYAGDGWCPALS